MLVWHTFWVYPRARRALSVVVETGASLNNLTWRWGESGMPVESGTLLSLNNDLEEAVGVDVKWMGCMCARLCMLMVSGYDEYCTMWNFTSGEVYEGSDCTKDRWRIVANERVGENETIYE